MCGLLASQHFPVSHLYLFRSMQSGQNSNGSSPLIINLILIKVCGERRSVQIDMWNIFLILRIPKMFPDMLLKIISYLRPFGNLIRVIQQLQIIIKRQYHHGIIINIDSEMGILIYSHSPGMFRLHISPIGRSCPDQQAIPVVILLLHQVFQGPLHAVQHTFPINFRLQIGGIATPFYIFINSLNQGSFLIGFYGILMCSKTRLSLGQAIFIPLRIMQISLMNINKTIHYIACFTLEVKKRIQISPYRIPRHYLHSQFYKCIVITYPDFAIPVSGIKPF